MGVVRAFSWMSIRCPFLELQPLLSEADLALGRLDGLIQILPTPDLFVFMYVRKLADEIIKAQRREIAEMRHLSANAAEGPGADRL
jgi:hypothetical protein